MEHTIAPQQKDSTTRFKPSSNLARYLQRQAKTRPEAAALIDVQRGRRRVCTFGDLEQQAAQAATLLHQQGLRRGDAVLVLQPMSAELYVALAAIFRLGLMAVVLDPSAGRAHVAACCRMHPIKGFIGSPKAHLLRLLVPGVRRIPHRFVIGPKVPGAVPWEASRRLPAHQTIASCSADTPALLTFTSGSTGQPKAAVRTHGLLEAQYHALRAALRLQPGQIDLTTLPIFALANLAAGVTSVIPDADLRRPGRIDAEPVIDQIQCERPTRTGAAPAFLERLLAGGASAAFAGMKYVFTGGAPVFPDLMDRLRTSAPDADVVAVYGSTEAEPIAEMDHDALMPEDREKIQTGGGLPAGRPVDAVSLRVLPDRWGTPLGAFSQATFEAQCLPPGAVGEIVVSGAHVIPGYLGGQGDAETKFSVGGVRWYRTGDAGYLDGDGRLWLLGRCSAKAEDARGVLYPLAVEAAASAWPGVRRAALLATENGRLLFVEAQTASAPPDLVALHRALGWAYLDRIRLLPALPLDRRHNAKIDYPALREQARKILGTS